MKHNNGTMSADIYQQQQHQHQTAQQRQSQHQQNQGQYGMNQQHQRSPNMNAVNPHSPNLHPQQNQNQNPQNQRQQNYHKQSNTMNHRIHQQPSIGSPSSTAHHSYSYGSLPGQPRENQARLAMQANSPKQGGTTHEITNLGQPSLLTAQRSQGSRSAPFADVNSINEHNQQNNNTNYYNNNQVKISIQRSKKFWSDMFVYHPIFFFIMAHWICT